MIPARRAAQAATGRLVPIAIAEAKRSARWPGVPTVSDTYAGREVTFFVGMSAACGVPPQIAAELHRAQQEAHSDPEFKAPLESVGLTFVRLPLGE